MSRICSKIDSINGLCFEPITAKPIAVTKITAVDSTIVALGTDGKIYTNAVASRVAYSLHGEDGKIARALDGCIKLGALTAKAVREHKADVQARTEKRDRIWAAARINDYATQLGIVFTDEQLRKIEGGAA